MAKRKFTTLREAEISHFKKHPKELKAYLKIAFEEYNKDNDERVLLEALRIVVEAKGFSKISKATGLDRAGLYRTLTPKGDPRLSTLTKVINSVGLHLRVA